jgi:Phosphodiester glycosidase
MAFGNRSPAHSRPYPSHLTLKNIALVGLGLLETKIHVMAAPIALNETKTVICSHTGAERSETGATNKDSLGCRLSFLQKRVCRFAAFVVLGAFLHGDFWEQGHPHQPVKIFAGVTYGCERLAVTQEGGGLVHWVRIDLTTPGVELYVTPRDPAAVVRGWQYRLRLIEDVVEREHLAVAVNGTYFTTASGSWLRFSGDLARSMQTLISDHVIAYGPWGATLIWFDADLAPHVLRWSSAAESVLTRAKWAVGAHELQLHNGQVLGGGDSTADARTAIGIDQPRKLLFLAIAERISTPRMLHVLANLGARDGFLLDGGGSSAMGIGQGSTGTPATVLLGGGRPVATYIGVRAPPCRNPVNVGLCD